MEDDSAVIFELLNKAYRALEQLEKELKDIRRSLPEEDAMRMRLLVLEGMCRIALIKKRGAGELMKVLLDKVENDVLEVSDTACHVCNLESPLCECWDDHYTSE